MTLDITARVWGLVLAAVILVAFGGEILISLLGCDVRDAEPNDEDGES